MNFPMAVSSLECIHCVVAPPAWLQHVLQSRSVALVASLSAVCRASSSAPSLSPDQLTSFRRSHKASQQHPPSAFLADEEPFVDHLEKTSRDAERDRAMADPANQKDGYLPCIPGDSLGRRYVLIRMLGQGQSSQVWLAKSAGSSSEGTVAEREEQQRRKRATSNRLYAIKVYRCEDAQHDSMLYERSLMRFVSKRLQGPQTLFAAANGHVSRSETAASPEGICALRDDFVHQGPHGAHPCLVFDVLGPAVDWLMRVYDFQGVPHPCVVRCIIRATLRTLIRLDECHVVHTDLKPENLLFTHSEEELLEMLKTLDDDPQSNTAPRGGREIDFSVAFIDFGLSYVVPPELRCPATAASRNGRHRQLSREEQDLLRFGNYKKGSIIQTREYRAPEIILGAHFGTKADVWSLGCMTYELVTGQFLFDPKSHPDVSDEKSMDCRHLYEISTVAGSPSLKWLHNGRGEHAAGFFDVKSWRFTGPRALLVTPARDLAADVLPYTARYMPDEESALHEAELIADFVRCCIQWDPSGRSTPQQLYSHPWLDQE